jgi:hypothetical protein
MKGRRLTMEWEGKRSHVSSWRLALINKIHGHRSRLARLDHPGTHSVPNEVIRSKMVPILVPNNKKGLAIFS